MSKPEGIPQDDWDMATRFWRDSGCSTGTATPFARAILAAKAEEREACALVAEGRFTLKTVQKNAKGHPYSAGSTAIYAAGQIAAAIRKRSEA